MASLKVDDALQAIAALQQEKAELLKVLKSVHVFLRNGIELGYIRMPDPDSHDPALEVPAMVRQAITKAERAK